MMKIVNISRAVKTCRTFDETMIREDGTVETDYYGVDTGVYARYTILDSRAGLKNLAIVSDILSDGMSTSPETRWYKNNKKHWWSHLEVSMEKSSQKKLYKCQI